MSWILVRSNFNNRPLDLSPYIEIYRDFGVENTLEDDQGLQGCVVETDSSQSIVDQLKTALTEGGADQVVAEPYVEQDWEITWKQFFKPRRVGKRFVVQPTWEPFEALPGDILLLLDPGQAFGTGDHPTTRMCLQLIEEIPLQGKQVADVGCGSGILSIACAKLGAEVLAIDIDEIALEVAQENAQRNGVTLQTYCGDGLFKLDKRADLSSTPQDETPLELSIARSATVVESKTNIDLVVSNIISATLIRLAEQLTHPIKVGGNWIVSGIIEQNWPDVQAAAEDLGLKLQAERHEDGWVAATFKKS